MKVNVAPDRSGRYVVRVDGGVVAVLHRADDGEWYAVDANGNTLGRRGPLSTVVGDTVTYGIRWLSERW